MEQYNNIGLHKDSSATIHIVGETDLRFVTVYCNIVLSSLDKSCDSYNHVPRVMEGVPSSRDYNGGFASKLMASN
ncbi:hypothetical protein AHAS_Ahas02G0153100 [Arachis hypogaea]